MFPVGVGEPGVDVGLAEDGATSRALPLNQETGYHLTLDSDGARDGAASRSAFVEARRSTFAAGPYLDAATESARGGVGAVARALAAAGGLPSWRACR